MPDMFNWKSCRILNFYFQNETIKIWSCLERNEWRLLHIKDVFVVHFYFPSVTLAKLNPIDKWTVSILIVFPYINITILVYMCDKKHIEKVLKGYNTANVLVCYFISVQFSILWWGRTILVTLAGINFFRRLESWFLVKHGFP